MSEQEFRSAFEKGITEKIVHKLFRTVLSCYPMTMEWTSKQPPLLTRKGESRPRYQVESPPLSHEKMMSLFQKILNKNEWKTLKETGTVAFEYVLDANGGPFRTYIKPLNVAVEHVAHDNSNAQIAAENILYVTVSTTPDSIRVVAANYK